MSDPGDPIGIEPPSAWRLAAEDAGASVVETSDVLHLDRRRALKLMSAALAGSLGGCGALPEEIVPYVRMPERLTPGVPLRFATSLALNGVAQPVVVTSHEGRPTKIEGNLEHSASGGSTNAFTQAAVLSLYDPARSRVPLHNGQLSSWDALRNAVIERAQSWRAGAKVCILTGTVTSASLAAQLATLRTLYPNLSWRSWEPIDQEAVLAGAELAFGRRLEPRHHFDRAAVVLALDADFLGPGPQQVLSARNFAKQRRARQGSARLARLFTAEPCLTLTGAAADHRLPLARGKVLGLAQAVANALGAGTDAPELSPTTRDFVSRAVRELQSNRGRALVVAGLAQPPEVHSLAHWINGQLGALGTTVDLIEPIAFEPTDKPHGLSALMEDLRSGDLDALIILGGNPAYDAPADSDFARALRAVPFSLHLGAYVDETAELCTWHAPALHELESWGDGRGFDGSTCLTQPLITPLFGGYCPNQLLAVLAGQLDPSGYTLVRDYWQANTQTDNFDDWWRQALHDGYVAHTASPPVSGLQPKLPPIAAPPSAEPGFELAFLADSSVWDGRFADNAWLQELPRPLTKLVWGNALLVSSPDAAALKVRDGVGVRVSTQGRSLDAVVLVAPGQAPGSLGLHLGYGRRTGAIAEGVGSDANALRSLSHLWANDNVTLTTSAQPFGIAVTQTTKRMEGRDIVRTVQRHTLTRKKAEPDRHPPTLYPPVPPGDHAWAMVIDQSVCIGCNACIVACQAENNVPVVGPDEVRRGRDMHWLRVDTYLRGPSDNPDVCFQPVPCMHCEKAPCEPMCPVEAAVHDSEGLNVQVYNRCIGTRFCQANCPYKVRRFNFFGYGDGQEYADLGDPLVQAVHNPDVTVRARGVMEKCTYCVQRISRARRSAEKEGRAMRDGDVVTACEAACPVGAIVFGDLQQEGSEVSRLRQEPHHYALLEHLGTRPRTTYLARVREGDPEAEPMP